MQNCSINIITDIIQNKVVFIIIIYLLFFTRLFSQGTDQNFLINENNLNIVNSQDSTQTVITKSKSPKKAMICSLVFPGLGQLYNGKKLKALVIFGTECGLLVNSITLNQKYHQSKTQAEKDFYFENRNLSTWWFAGVILFSVLDAYVDAQLSDFDESPDLGFQLLPSSNDKRYLLTCSFTF